LMLCPCIIRTYSGMQPTLYRSLGRFRQRQLQLKLARATSEMQSSEHHLRLQFFDLVFQALHFSSVCTHMQDKP
jgi:hypothetical protein